MPDPLDLAAILELCPCVRRQTHADTVFHGRARAGSALKRSPVSILEKRYGEGSDTMTPEQAAQIRDAMQRIAARRPGRTKLVYDKSVGLVAVSDDGTRTPLNIVAEETE